MMGQEALSLVDTLLHSANPEQRLNDVQSVVLLETWAGRSYREVAEQLGYQHDYIKQVGSQLWRSLSQTLGEPVSKRNIQAVLRRYQLSQQAAIPSAIAMLFDHASQTLHALPVIQGKQDWGEAIDVSRFYGRQGELQRLETWILQDCCRAIGIFGLGGMGKTALSVKFAQQVQSQFDFVIWRSLQQAPSLSTLLSDILPILAGSEVTTDGSINTLMKQLRSKRCLLVLDNVESILQDGNRGGQYQPDYEAYRQLFDRMLIETGNENLTQQPVIIEYVTERFIQTIDREITTGNLNLFRTYALIEAQTQDYERDAQIQRILHSLTERLLTHFATQAQLEEHFCQILASLRHQTATQTGYAWSNLLNLFCHLKTLHGHQQTVRAIAFSPDGQQLASGSFDRTVKMWDVQTGECCQTLKGHNSVWSVTFSPNREWLLSASFDQTLKPWDVRTGQFYQTLAGHSELIYTLLVASIQLGDEDSARLTAVSGSLDESIKLWDLQARNCWQTLRVPRPYEGIQELTEAPWTTLKTLGAASRA